MYTWRVGAHCTWWDVFHLPAQSMHLGDLLLVAKHGTHGQLLALQRGRLGITMVTTSITWHITSYNPCNYGYMYLYIFINYIYIHISTYKWENHPSSGAKSPIVTSWESLTGFCLRSCLFVLNKLKAMIGAHVQPTGLTHPICSEVENLPNCVHSSTHQTIRIYQPVISNITSGVSFRTPSGSIAFWLRHPMISRSPALRADPPWHSLVGA